MHSYLLTIVLNHSVIIPAVISAVRFKTISRGYQPFILLLWLGLLNETISLALIYTKGYNTVNSNIYVLLECFLILYQFYCWQTISRPWMCTLLMLAGTVWIFDNLVWHTLSSCNAVFRITYSFIVAGCCIKQINAILAWERFSLFKNPVFLVCFAFLFYYSCKAAIEVFYACHVQLGAACTRDVFTILYVDDFVSNIIYSIALLCIPKLEIFSLPY